MKLSAEAETASILGRLTRPNLAAAARRAGEPASRQPVHTVYGGAQLFRHDIAARLGQRALAALETYGGDPFTFARALGLPGADALPTKKKEAKALLAKADSKESAPEAWLARTVHERVRAKLTREPVEDFRIDFEDGFGHRPDDEEDAVAVVAADQVARGLSEGVLPPFLGVRIKPLNEALKRRAARTLDVFFTVLVEKTGGALPPWFAVTLPKVEVPEQLTALADLLAQLERKLGLDEGRVKIELMVELPQTIVGPDGALRLARMIDAANGRLVSAHLGAYDLTAACNVTAPHQRLDHPQCALARQHMQLAFAGTPVALSDGATTLLPIPVHREAAKKKHAQENAAAVHAAWARACRDIEAALAAGFYQGWDLHPAQIPVRYAATYAFFLQSFDAMAPRLRRFVDRAAQASRTGAVFDDAATGQGLLNFFLRGLHGGALTLEDLAATGLTDAELATRSFEAILASRAGR